MESNSTTIITMDNNTTNTEESARQSSKLSLGSSPSVLSVDEQLEGDGPLTPIDKMQDDVEDDDDDLSALNSILQAGSPGSLSDEEEEEEEDDDDNDDGPDRNSEGDDEEEEDEDDLHTEQDSASPLSSVPDDFPLSRSASPDLPLVQHLHQEEEEADGEDEDEDEEDAITTNTTTPHIRPREEKANDKDDDDDEDDDEVEEEEEEEEVVVEEIKSRKLSISGHLITKKRRKDDSKKKLETREESDSDNVPSPPKKAKQSEAASSTTAKEGSKNTDTSSSSEDNNTRKRRASRSILDITESPRTRRRQSRQDELIAKTEIEQAVQETPLTPKMEENSAESMDVDDLSEEKDAPVETRTDENGKDFDKQKNHSKYAVTIERSESLQVENGDESEEQRGNHEVQDNDDHDYQHRHQEALDALTHIEVEFARLRDKMYQEKMAELHDEARMIADGTHPELVTLLAEIEEKKGKRIHSAEAWRKYQHDNFKQQFEGLEYQANIHFISQKNALRRDLLTMINGKRWTMEDERTKLNDPARGNEREFPDGRELVVHKREQKEETDELQDIKEAIGFPMAPNPSGLGVQDVDDDLKLLGIKHS